MNSSWSRDARARRATPGRARRLAIGVFAVLLLLVTSGSARSSGVPASVQAALISKVAGFDRNYRARAGQRALVLIVQANDDSQSARDAASIKSALSELSTVGSLPHEEQTVTYTNAAALAGTVRSRRAAIVYFSSGLSGHTQAIKHEFSSLDVLTVAADPDDVPDGIVLGVDLVSGRPKLLFHLTQAKKQKVSLPASVLKLMKVYQ
jgi:hypothetical protein